MDIYHSNMFNNNNLSINQWHFQLSWKKGCSWFCFLYTQTHLIDFSWSSKPTPILLYFDMFFQFFCWIKLEKIAKKRENFSSCTWSFFAEFGFFSASASLVCPDIRRPLLGFSFSFSFSFSLVLSALLRFLSRSFLVLSFFFLVS